MTDYEMAQVEDELMRMYRWNRVKAWLWPIVTVVIVGAALWEVFVW